MIHTIHTMTIRRYSRIDNTANLNLLRRWYNPLPVRWFNTDKYFEAHNNVFGNSINLNKEIYTTKVHNIIMELNIYYDIILLIMQAQNQQTVDDILNNKDPKTLKTNLPYYIEQVKEITGIKIKDGNDLKKLHKEIRRRTDKYQENNQKPKETKKIPFSRSALQIFEVTNENYNPYMTISELGELKVIADDIIKDRQSNGAE